MGLETNLGRSYGTSDVSVSMKAACSLVKTVVELGIRAVLICTPTARKLLEPNKLFFLLKIVFLSVSVCATLTAPTQQKLLWDPMVPLCAKKNPGVRISCRAHACPQHSVSSSAGVIPRLALSTCCGLRPITAHLQGQCPGFI